MLSIFLSRIRESFTFGSWLKNKLLLLWKLIDKYFFVLIGLFFLGSAIHISFTSNAGIDYKILVYLLAFASFTAYSEIRKDVKWLPFLLFSIPFILIIQYISINGYSFWGKMLSWQISKNIVFDLNPLFSKIPLNDAAFMRVYQSDTLTWFMRLVYQNGFVLPVILPLYRACISKDLKKAIRYALSAHIFQVFLITPFYLMFHLQEVWYVLGHPDGMARNFTPEQAAGWTLNCFPSMHTSIAFAMFLLVLREKNRLFKWIWGFFCLSVIFSTMYLEIHWVIDVIGGLILGYGTVKLVDFVLAKADNLLYKPLGRFYYRHQESTYLTKYLLDIMD